MPRIHKSKLANIVNTVSTNFGISEELLCAKNRTKTVALARATAMYALREFCGYSYPEIGRFFNKDHKTAWNAYKKIDAFLDKKITLSHRFIATSVIISLIEIKEGM